MGTWTPNTCTPGMVPEEQCEIELADDGSWNFKRFTRICPVHTTLSTDQDRWNCIIDENSRGFSNVLDAVVQAAPSTVFDIETTSTGAQIKVLKKNLTTTWNWLGTVPNRTLEVKVIGVVPTTTQRNSLNTLMTNRFGSGKVTLIFSMT